MVNEIHTGFYSDEFYTLLETLYRYMSHGIYSYELIKNTYSTTIDREPDGEVVIHVHNYNYGTIYLKKQKQSEILAWLGLVLKRQTQYSLERNGLSMKDCWKHDNFENSILEFSNDNGHQVYVADMFYLYDALKNHKNIDKKYDNKLIEKWRGVQNDPIVTETECTRRNEIKKVEAKYDAKIKNCDFSEYRYDWKSPGNITDARIELNAKYKVLEDEFIAKVKQMEEEYGGKWKKEAERLKIEKAEKIKEINNEFSFVKMLGNC